MIQGPCKDCVDRKVSCHSTCEKYLAFKERKAEEQRVTNNKREYDLMVASKKR